MSSNNNAGSTMAAGPLGILFGKGFFQQVLLVLVILSFLFLLFISVEFLITSYKRIGGRFVNLLPLTVTAEDKMLTFQQNKTAYEDAKQIPLSDNERTGIEFTYSFYLLIHPSTFTGEDVLFHVMHKGYTNPWPLMGPGVFVKGNTNALRIVMNTYRNAYTYMDVENVPVRKWFHCVLLCRKNSLEIYINGNLRKKLPFEGTLPYQNFQNLVCFSPLKKMILGSQVASLGSGNDLRFEGSFRGNMSNLTYLAYAASFTEIQSLMDLGVSKKTMSAQMDKPPYLVDTYWTTSYQLQE
jgi:hypothetical protein